MGSIEHAIRLVADHLGVSFGELLGIGDTPADWNFMQLCKYVAMVGDNQQLAQLIATKPGAYAGKNVDQNGLLDIFEHFGL